MEGVYKWSFSLLRGTLDTLPWRLASSNNNDIIFEQ